MSFTVDDRVLALAGIAQALQQVRRIADTGHSDAAAVRTAVDSVFRVDASSPQEVFGDRGALKAGLRLLHNYFRSQGQDPILPKLALLPRASNAPSARPPNWATAATRTCWPTWAACMPTPSAT
ncbi:hypothetical protein G6F56_013712 [Rhizopus delemar]|nr:hypothetical protein G6F56_013712 [Rhizopus delemar]